MIAGGATHTAARLLSLTSTSFCPLCLRETINQPLAILLLIVLTVRRIFAAAMITGTNTMMLIRRILWREITVIAQHLLQLCQFRRCRNMADLRQPNTPGESDVWLNRLI